MAPAPDQACSLQTLQAQINALSTSLRGGQRGGQRGGNRGGQGGGATHNSTEFCKYCGYVGHDKPKCNIKKKDEAKGLFLAQSPYFEPGRVGRGEAEEEETQAEEDRWHTWEPPWIPEAGTLNNKGQPCNSNGHPCSLRHQHRHSNQTPLTTRTGEPPPFKTKGPSATFLTGSRETSKD